MVSLLPMVFWLVSEDVEVERLDLGRQIDSITLPSAWEVHFSGDGEVMFRRVISGGRYQVTSFIHKSQPKNYVCLYYIHTLKKNHCIDI